MPPIKRKLEFKITLSRKAAGADGSWTKPGATFAAVYLPGSMEPCAVAMDQDPNQAAAAAMADAIAKEWPVTDASDVTDGER